MPNSRNFATTIGVLAAGTTSTISTTNAVVGSWKGKANSAAALTNQATPTTDINTGAAFVPVTPSKGSVFVYGFKIDDTLVCAQGSLEDLDSSGAFKVAPQFPVIPDTVVPFAYLIIKASSTAAAGGWVQGTNNQASVTGITYTRVDILEMPDRPQID